MCKKKLTNDRERALYLGLLGMFYAVASGIGPVLGGVFTDKLNWRWCFWINRKIK
jgi:MFS family permease